MYVTFFLKIHTKGTKDVGYSWWHHKQQLQQKKKVQFISVPLFLRVHESGNAVLPNCARYARKAQSFPSWIRSWFLIICNKSRDAESEGCLDD